MRRTALISLVGALIVAVALVSASSAAPLKVQTVTRIDVSTRAAVIHYLHSIHVKAKGAVIQRGFRNYAGSRCPGKHWTCARARHTVVQITGHGGSNRFACRSAHCVVVQISGVSHGVYVFGRQLAAKGGGGGNNASCVKTGSGATTGTGQSCVISQSGTGQNTAAIYQNSMKVSGLLAAAAYQASISQTVTSTGSNGNQACVLQSINLDGSTTGLKGKAVSVTLDGHQSVQINQDVAGSGLNRADQAAVLNSGGTTASCDTTPNGAILQSQTITSTVNGTAGIVQNLDKTQISCGGGTVTPLSPSANICLDIEQNKGSGVGHATGPNSAVFDQENTLVALANTSASGSITQIQGNSDPTIGGLAAKVNQNSIGGVSMFTATQNEKQCEDAFVNTPQPTPTVVANCGTGQDPPSGLSLTQQQYGPEGMGVAPTKQNGRIHYQKVTKDAGDSSQTGNNTDSFTVAQNSKQTNDTNNVQKNSVTGGASTPGTGTVNQNVTLQGDPKVDVQVGTGTVSSTITCNGSTKADCTKTLSAPVIDTNSEPSDPSTYPGSANFSFSNVDPTVNFLCKLDTGSYQTCETVTNNPPTNTTGSQSYSSLASGQHTFSVKTEDPDNHQTSAASTFSWVVTPPDPSIGATKPPNPDTFGNSESISFTDADGTAKFKCSLDGNAFTLCTSPVSLPSLASGSHTFTVRAYDNSVTYPSNNTADYTWVITPPDPTISDGPGTLPNPQTTSTDATFTFTDPDSTVKYQCNLDGGGYSSCSSNPTFSDLSHGPHTLVIKATDASGNYDSTGTAEYDWEVIPYLTFEVTPDGASAGWATTPGVSPITLKTGTDTPIANTTFAQFTIHDDNSLTVNGLTEPAFTTDVYSGGAPRYEIDFANGDYVFGYPAQAGDGTDSWQLVCNGGCVTGGFMSWSGVQSAENGQTITDALIDADFPANATYNITDFTYHGHSLSFFTG